MKLPTTTLSFPRRFLWPGYIVLVCSLSALCFGSLQGHLLDMDDHEALRDNIRMAEDFSFFFSSEKQQPGGRPLAELIKLAGYLIWGNDPGLFHLSVVAFHTLGALLLAILFSRQGIGLGTSLAGGLFFLVNVAHFRAVHWIAAIEFPLALSCGLGALLCYQHYLEHRRSRCLWGFYGGFVLSITALSAMAFLWPFCLYWSWLRDHDIRASLRLLLPLLPVLVLELILIVALTPRENSTWRAIDLFLQGDFFSLAIGTGRLMLWLLGRLLTTAHWLPFPLYELRPWELPVGAVVLAGLGVLMYWSRLHASLWSVWILLSLLPFLPLNDTLILGRPEGPSRYLYPATAGTSFLLAWGLGEARGRLGPWGRYVYACVLAAILVCSYFSLKRSEAISLYASGRNYISRGDGETGVEQLRRAIEQGRDVIDLLDTYDRICYIGMGMEGTEGILDEALAVFPRHLWLTVYKVAFDSLKPDSVLSRRAREQLEGFKSGETRVSIGVGWRGRIVLSGQENIQAVRRSIASFYHNVGINLGTGRVNREDLNRAIPAYQLSLEFDPDRMKTYETLARALVLVGRRTEAVRLAVQAVERNADAPPGLLIAASSGLLAAGRAGEAIAHCHRALQVEGVTDGQRETVFRIYDRILNGTYRKVSSSACVRMGMDLLDGGRAEDAVNAFRQALAKDGDNRRAHFGLGLALLAQGQVEEAEKVYAEGLARFGPTAAQESGAVAGLRSLVAQGIQQEGARKILATHWPEL